MKRALLLLCFLFLWASVACTAKDENSVDLGGLPTPTIHPLFVQFDETPTLQQSPTSPDLLTATPVPPVTVSITDSITTTTVSIYDELLSTQWQLLENPEVETNLYSTKVVHQGRFAIEFTPQEDYTKMYFILREDAEDVFEQKQVISLNFWINNGNNILELDDLTVTLIGSNEYPYWVEGDDSVYVDGEFPFSETRLYYLGLNRAVQPNTWVEVVVLLDTLIYDPDYSYITGFYIKNDEGIHSTFYIDDVRILMVRPEE
jgi:hypothetical protein